MRCKKAKAQLSLFVGGDLSQQEILEFRAHLARCSNCQHEFDIFKRSQTLMEQIAREDVPDPLPSDFSWQVHQKIREDSAERSGSERRGLRIPQRKFIIAFGGVALILLIALVLSQEFRQGSSRSGKEPSYVPQRMVDTEPSVITWDDKTSRIAQAMDGPYRFDAWNPPREAGIYAILHKQDLDAESEIYVIDYCGENRNLSSFKNYPWLHTREKRLISRAGSRDNIYIAVCLMPESTRRDRRVVEKTLIDEFNPYFNRKKGA